jgi:alpha-1,3-fucosyltransferase
MVLKTVKRKKYSFLLIICVFLLLLFVLHIILSNYVKYPNWTLLTEYSEYSHFSIIAKHNLSIDENLNYDNYNEANNKRRPKTIILWTQFFGTKDYVNANQLNNCLVNNCIFTSNRSLLRESDSVLFHLRDLDINDLPNQRSPHQRWILLNHESPPNSPNLLKHLDGLINWTATYRYGSDIFLSPIIQRRSNPNIEFNPNKNYAQNKTRMIVWLASNCITASKREKYVEELKKTVTVDVFGQCGDKECLPKMSEQCLEQLSKEYRFILAFENSICRDYVTEKYFNALNYDIIPVVFGGSDYHRIAPKNSFIDALSYSSPRHLARYLLYLSKHHNQYNKYFKWKRDYELTVDPYPCQICRKLNNPKEPIKVWHHLNSWWFQESNCKSWSPSKFV